MVANSNSTVCSPRPVTITDGGGRHGMRGIIAILQQRAETEAKKCIVSAKQQGGTR